MKTRIIQEEPKPAEGRPYGEPAAARRRRSLSLPRLLAALGARLGRRSSQLSNGGT